jgi:iron complex outermembrane receptor protein
MNNKILIKRSVLATAIAIAVHGTTVHAAEEDGVIEEVVVVGIRGSLQRAVDIKRDSGTFTDAISAEDIGKFPDQNVAESLQRIPGVTISRVGGEGRFVSVRGFGPEHTAVLVNDRVLATENNGREFSFDILASELISGAEVHKTPSARLQEGGIGATINTKTARPFDFSGFKAAASVKGIYDDNADSTTPEYSGLISNRFMDDRFGVLVSVAVREKDFTTHRTFPEGMNKVTLDNLDSGVVMQDVYVSTWLGFDQNESTRNRKSGAFALQFEASDDVQLTLDGLYSQLDLDAESKVPGTFYGPSDIAAATVDSNGTVLSYTSHPGAGFIGFHSARRPRFAETEQIGFNAEWARSEQAVITFDTSYSKAEDSTAGVQNWFGVQVPIDADNVSTVTWNGQSSPTMSMTSDVSDLSQIKPGDVIFEGTSIEDEIFSANVDYQYDFDYGSSLRSFYAGFAYSERTKTQLSSKTEGGGFFGFNNNYTGFIPESVFSLTDGYFGVSFPSWNGDELAAYLASPEGMAGLSPENAAAFAERGNTFAAVPIPTSSGDAEEETFAMYFQLDLEGEVGDMTWSGNMGLRYVSTDVVSHGSQQPVLGFEIVDPDSVIPEFTTIRGPLSPVSAKGDYSRLLPSANFALDLREDLILRLAASQTVTRPTLSQILFLVSYDLRPGLPDGLKVREGNPGLEPFESLNFDIGLEWYFGETSYMSAAYFSKKFSNEIQNATDKVTIAGEEFIRERPVNQGDENYDGIELAVQYLLSDSDSMPDALEGFGVSANYTQVSKDRIKAFNAGMFYENGPLSARVSYSWRDDYVLSPNGSHGEELSQAAFGQIDASVSYNITDNVAISFEGINLNDEEEVRYSMFENRVYETTNSGARYLFGVRASF